MLTCVWHGLSIHGMRRVWLLAASHACSTVQGLFYGRFWLLTYYILSCSTIVELGEGVTDLAVGDRVAMEPGIPCWTNKSSRCAASCCEGQRAYGA